MSLSVGRTERGGLQVSGFHFLNIWTLRKHMWGLKEMKERGYKDSVLKKEGLCKLSSGLLTFFQTGNRLPRGRRGAWARPWGPIFISYCIINYYQPSSMKHHSLAHGAMGAVGTVSYCSQMCRSGAGCPQNTTGWSWGDSGVESCLETLGEITSSLIQVGRTPFLAVFGWRPTFATGRQSGLLSILLSCLRWRVNPSHALNPRFPLLQPEEKTLCS